MNSDHISTTVTILGSGTCVPSLKRSSCSILIKTGRTKLLFDAGPGTMHRLLGTGTDIFDISFIFISHFHPDHTGELASFLFATKYPDQSRRKDLLTVVSGKGFIKFYNNLKTAYKQWIELAPGLIKIIELDNKGYDFRRFNDFTVESYPVEHNCESIGYKITDSRQKTIVYSGDTDYCENLVNLSQNADLLILECSFPDHHKVDGHLTPQLAGLIAKEARTKKLLLTHFYPMCDKYDLKIEAKGVFEGEICLAEDFMKLKI